MNLIITIIIYTFFSIIVVMKVLVNVDVNVILNHFFIYLMEVNDIIVIIIHPYIPVINPLNKNLPNFILQGNESPRVNLVVVYVILVHSVNLILFMFRDTVLNVIINVPRNVMKIVVIKYGIIIIIFILHNLLLYTFNKVKNHLVLQN